MAPVGVNALRLIRGLPVKIASRFCAVFTPMRGGISLP
jgi:hypothetical protein